jgi:hypothetical protein
MYLGVAIAYWSAYEIALSSGADKASRVVFSYLLLKCTTLPASGGG